MSNKLGVFLYKDYKLQSNQINIAHGVNPNEKKCIVKR
jgi:hypothetical protein